MNGVKEFREGGKMGYKKFTNEVEGGVGLRGYGLVGRSDLTNSGSSLRRGGPALWCSGSSTPGGLHVPSPFLGGMGRIERGLVRSMGSRARS